MEFLCVGIFFFSVSDRTQFFQIRIHVICQDFAGDQEKNFQDKYNWGDSEEIWDDTEKLPEELDESDEVKEQLNGERQYE